MAGSARPTLTYIKNSLPAWIIIAVIILAVILDAIRNAWPKKRLNEENNQNQ
jgi:hypothetical protein